MKLIYELNTIVPDFDNRRNLIDTLAKIINDMQIGGILKIRIEVEE